MGCLPLVGKTSWSKDAVNGTHQNPEWNFPWDVRVPLPRTLPQGRTQAQRPGTRSKEQMERTFSVWKFSSGSLDYLSRHPVFSARQKMVNNQNHYFF